MVRKYAGPKTLCSTVVVPYWYFSLCALLSVYRSINHVRILSDDTCLVWTKGGSDIFRIIYALATIAPAQWRKGAEFHARFSISAQKFVAC